MEYKVLSRLNHNGEIYEANQLIELDQEVAAGLIEAGVIAGLEEEKQEESTGREDVVTQPAEKPTAPEAPSAPEPPSQPAAPEAPADEAPLDSTASSEPSVDEQLKANVAQDLADSEALAEAPAQPVDGQPTEADVAATAAEVK